MSLKTRLDKLENTMKAQKPGWVWEVEALIASGKFTRKDALSLGTVVFDYWPEWFTDMPDARQIAKEADRKNDEEMMQALGKEQYYELLDRIHNNDITDNELHEILSKCW